VSLAPSPWLLRTSGGGFVPHPIRPAYNRKNDDDLGKRRPMDMQAHARFAAAIRGIPPEKR